MEQFLYTCGYCNKQFEPKRRKVQKFCSTSCRVRNHQISKQLSQINKVVKVTEKAKKETINPAGIGNAFLGSAALEVGMKLLIPQHRQPATKGDIQRLESKLERYQKIENQPPRLDGKWPYFDTINKIVVYL